MNFREFLEVADGLVQGDTEGDWRSAVSRAYYAAFHVGRTFLQALGFQVPQAEQAHGFIWLRLSNCNQADLQSTGSGLNDLRKNRNQADYDERRFVSAHRAADAVAAARDIIETLDAAFAEPFRTQITEAIKTYERDVLKEVTWKPP